MNPVVEFAEAYLHASVQYRTFEDACRRLRDCGDTDERRSLVDVTLRLAMSVTESIDDAESRLTDASAFVRINGADSRLTEDMRLASGILKEDRARASSYAMAVASRRMGGPLPEPRRPQASNPFVFDEEDSEEIEDVEESEETAEVPEADESDEVEEEIVEESEDAEDIFEVDESEDSEEDSDDSEEESEDDNSEDESIVESEDTIEEPEASEEESGNPLAAETERILSDSPVPPAKPKRRSLIGRLRRWRASRPSFRFFSPSYLWERSSWEPASAATYTS